MDYNEQLINIVRGNDDLMTILKTIRSLKLQDWALGAGVLRDIVWSHLHQFEIPRFKDIDVVYFDLSADKKMDDEIENILINKIPQYPWDVKNQAFVHEWYAAKFGFEVRPLESLTDAISTWPETATCIGISLTENDEIRIHAPHGLDDLFEIKLRWNQTRVPIEEFWRRLESKNMINKWPRITVIREYEI